MPTPIRVHVIAGGFPPGKHTGHDIDYARMRIRRYCRATRTCMRR